MKKILIKDSTSALLRIPEEALKALGWSQNESVWLEIPTAYPDQLIVHRSKGEEIPAKA